MKYIAFGIGGVYKSFCNNDIKKEIIAYTDNNYANINEFEKKPLIPPTQIKLWSFDYVVIYSSDFFEEIFIQLVDVLNIPENKVISFLDVSQDCKHITLQRCGQNTVEIIKKMHWLKILDFTAFFINLYFSRINMIIDDRADIDVIVGQSDKIYPIYSNLYKNMFLSEISSLPEYDAIIWSYLSYRPKRLQDVFYYEIIKSSRYLLIVLPYLYDFKEEDQRLLMLQYGVIIYSEYKEYGKFFILDTRPDEVISNFKIYVISHKEFKMPEDSLYESIYVGKYGLEKEFLKSDSRGDNIAKYNLFINETTALYWIWKHSYEEYVGICHYRRYFLQEGKGHSKNILSKPVAEAILENYDIILPQPIFIGNIKEQLERHVDLKAFDNGWSAITSLIREKQPDYLDAYDYFFNCSNIMYPCNMFVTKKETIDHYCEWLFSFILDAVEASDFSKYDNYSQRIIGFFIERLFNVWLIKQDLKIMELSILLKDEL